MAHLRKKNSNKSESIIQDIKTLEHEAIDYVKTLTWAQIEEWQKDNEYIIGGYRRVQNNWNGCVYSVYGYLHNETVNIHSHLWGAIFFLFLLVANESLVTTRYPTMAWTDSVMFSIFLASAVFCMMASAIYHISTSHSEPVHSRCHALDYSGIVVLIVGSFFPALFYAFFCDFHLQVLYLSVITIFGLAAAYIVLNPEYAKPTHRGARTKVFIALGLSAVLPVSHALFSHGVHTVRVELGFDWIILSGAFYIGGALLYANRIPERLSPGTFDYFFASHQIFHVMVVIAALLHYIAVLTVIEHWHGKLSGTCAV